MDKGAAEFGAPRLVLAEVPALALVLSAALVLAFAVTCWVGR